VPATVRPSMRRLLGIVFIALAQDDQRCRVGFPLAAVGLVVLLSLASVGVMLYPGAVTPRVWILRS